METIFEFLFKYRPLLFQEGELRFLWTGSRWMLLAGAVLAIGSTLSYGMARGRSSAVDRSVLAGFRLALLAILLFVLMQPALVLTSVVPQRNFVGILVDDSRSMAIADDEGGPSRVARVRAALAPDAPLVQALGEQYALRYVRFSRDAARADGVAGLTADGSASRLAHALDVAREELEGLPLSGLIVVSDGADTSNDPLTDALLPLQAAGVPVYTVGVGAEALQRDVQMGRINLPSRVLAGSSIIVEVGVTHQGYGGRTIPVQVEDGGRILASESVELAAGGQPEVVAIRITLENPGPRILRFRVPEQEGETVVENNVRELLVDVQDTRQKVLYLEGEPRFEVGFMRRAVQEDENIQLVVLQRTAEGKFLRLAVDDPDELVGGFPRTRAALFQYSGLILGSVEASFLTHDQLEMIADFVSRRGGGLLALGGRRAFLEGGYDGTAVEEVLPIVLDGTADRDRFTELSVAPTPAGLNHPATRIAPTAEASRERWESMPPVSTPNDVFELKPGATALLTGRADDDAPERVALAFQRFGRGKALALPIQDTWLWQMHADVPLEDLTHETFWRQLLRWLTDEVPDPVAARPGDGPAEPGSPVEIIADVRDSTYVGLNGAAVRATVTGPGGESYQAPLDWTVERDGEYRGTFIPEAPGIHQVSVEATRDGRSTGSTTVPVYVNESRAEYFDAYQRRPLLERIAEETGGRYYPLSDANRLPDDLQYTGAGVTVTEERDLWDMPAVFLLLVGVLAGEWFFRRRRGLA